MSKLLGKVKTLVILNPRMSKGLEGTLDHHPILDGGLNHFLLIFKREGDQSENGVTSNS